MRLLKDHSPTFSFQNIMCKSFASKGQGLFLKSPGGDLSAVCSDVNCNSWKINKHILFYSILSFGPSGVAEEEQGKMLTEAPLSTKKEILHVTVF